MKKLILVFTILILISCKKDTDLVLPSEWLHATVGENPGIFDELNRQVLLRGVNYNVFVDYGAANENVPTTKEYDKNDFKVMASYGINCVRLLFNWSALEPTRGVYNQSYINKIKQAIEDAAEYNIYIVIDMHQDAFGKFIYTPKDGPICEFPQKGWDGAPEWATITDSASLCSVSGSRESTPAVYHAFHNLWKNTDGIADACIASWKELVKQTCTYPNVAGYDLMNEPHLGYDDYALEMKRYSKFLSNLVDGIRETEKSAGGYEHIIFFENTIVWNGQELPGIPQVGFTKDENIVFSGHNYFESISTLFTIEQGFDLFRTISNLFKTTYYGGEWGFFGDEAEDVEQLKRYAQQEDKYFYGGAYWGWVETPGDPHQISWDGNTYSEKHALLIEVDKNAQLTGNKKELFLQVLARTRPNAIAGKPISLKSNSDNGEMTLKARAGDKTEITNLWIPDIFGEPKIEGDNVGTVNLTKIEGGYNADVEVKGIYEMSVSF